MSHATGVNKTNSGRSMPRSNFTQQSKAAVPDPGGKWDKMPPGSRRNVREKQASSHASMSKVLPYPGNVDIGRFADHVRQFSDPAITPWESFQGYSLQTMGVLLQLQNSLQQGDFSKAFNDAQEAKSAYAAACKELRGQRAKRSKPLDAAYNLLKFLNAAPDSQSLCQVFQDYGLEPNDPRLPAIGHKGKEAALAPVGIAQGEEKKQAGMPPLFDAGFPYVAASVVQQYLNEKGPKGPNAIKLKSVVVDGKGQITALEIFRKGSASKTKILDLQASSWKGTRLATHLKKTKLDFTTFIQKLQSELGQTHDRWSKSMLPFACFSPEKERALALTTLDKVMKALDGVDDVPSEFLRSKPQSVPRVTLHHASSRDLYEKSDLSQLDSLTGLDLRHFIDDLVSLSLESMFKNRQGRFAVEDVEAFATAFLSLGEPLESMMAKSKSERIFREVQPADGVIGKFLADRDAQDFVRAISQLLNKVASKSKDPEYKKDLHRTFTLLPFILGGVTSDALGMTKIVELKPSPSVTETELLRVSLIYGDCSKACVDRFMKNPEHYFLML